MTRWIAVPFVATLSLCISAAAHSTLPCPARTVINDGVCIGAGGVRIDCPVKQRVCVDADAPYTAEAAKANVKGTVRLTATVDTDGCAENIKVISRVGYGLDDSAVWALERWRFRVPQKRMTVSVEFNFDPKSSSLTRSTLPRCEEQVHASIPSNER